MRSSTVVIAAMASIAAATPVALPQMPDFAIVDSAPAVPTGPLAGAANQTDVYQEASAIADASKAVTAAASATGVNKRGDGSYGGGYGGSTSSIPATTSIPATLSMYQTATGTSGASTACPTTPEEGTYCGFINPEDACAPQPDGYGPHPTPDTVEAFQSYALFHEEAQSAVTPGGYENTFKDLNASVSANSYMGLYTLSSYDVLGCSQWCDNTTLCTGFNLYIERDPSLNPTSGNTTDTYCPNPSSITNYKCTLWGSGVEKEAATNYGDYRGQFHTVIVGSNGYEKTNNTEPPSCPGWNPPTNCDGGAIQKPNCGVGSGFFPGPFNPKVCASYAQAQASKNKQSVSEGQKYQPVNMFNAYMMKKNGKAMGTYCSLYNQFVDPSHASFHDGYSGSDHFSVESSWIYELNQKDDGIKN